MPAPSPSTLQLQDRDLSILRGLFESRVMTAAHVGVLFFDGKSEATKKRLQKLKAAGFISEQSRRVNEPSLLFLTRKAFHTLHDRGALSGYPPPSPSAFEHRSRVSALTLRHELEVMDAKAAFHAAIRENGPLLLVEFISWPLLCQFQAHPRNGDGELSW